MVSRWNSSGGVSADRSEGTPQKMRSPEPSSVTGGTTADVRHFGNAVPFMLSGGTSYDSRNFHTPQDMDVRNCLSSCKTPTSWFMSGPDVLSAYQLLNLDGSKLSIVNVAWSMGACVPWLVDVLPVEDSAGPGLGDLSQRQRMPDFPVRRHRGVCDLQL